MVSHRGLFHNGSRQVDGVKLPQQGGKKGADWRPKWGLEAIPVRL